MSLAERWPHSATGDIDVKICEASDYVLHDLSLELSKQRCTLWLETSAKETHFDLQHPTRVGTFSCV